MHSESDFVNANSHLYSCSDYSLLIPRFVLRDCDLKATVLDQSIICRREYNLSTG